MTKTKVQTTAADSRDVLQAGPEAAPEAEPIPAPQPDRGPGGPPSGFYIYIGPTIHRLIRSGTIYRGGKAHALAEVQKAIERYPLVKTLLVSGDQLPVARLKVKTSGNALHASYRRLAEQVRSDAAKK